MYIAVEQAFIISTRSVVLFFFLEYIIQCTSATKTLCLADNATVFLLQVDEQSLMKDCSPFLHCAFCIQNSKCASRDQQLVEMSVPLRCKPFFPY
uniref:Putative secreted protein n=1 Tax=Ixodes ricinus TaxID=34613 RepID=A0A6B0UE13_IXORI